MVDNQKKDIDLFLDQIHVIEAKVSKLIAKSNLSEEEKKYIMDHVLIVPGRK